MTVTLGRARLVHGLAAALWLVVAGNLMADHAGSEPGSSLFTFDRMGAGIPAGWRVTGENIEWTTDPGPGPVGVGSARIHFRGKGSVRLESPARVLRSQADHVLRLWLRGEPRGALVKVKFRDNGLFPKGSSSESLMGERMAAEEWQPLVARGKLPLAKTPYYYVELEIAGANCTVWIDGLHVSEAGGSSSDSSVAPRYHPVAVVLKPETPWGLVAGHEPMYASVTVVGAVTPGAKLRLKTIHTTGIVEHPSSERLIGQPVWNGQVEVNGKAGHLFGMIRLEATVMDAQERPLSATAETLLARVPTPVAGPIETSPFGIHVGLREPEISVAAKLGYKWCRAHDASGSTKWGLLEREPGQWSWQDESIALAGRHGLRILGLLDTSPPWASGVAGDGYWSIYGAPKDLEDWRRYVRTIVGRYAGTIDRWEVWNEPWNNAGGFRFFQGGNPLRYQELLKSAYTEAKRVNPKATMVGINTYPAQWDQAVLAAGAYSNLDVLSFHRYDHSLHGYRRDAMAFEADRLRLAQAKYGEPKPIELTEGGPDIALYHGSFFSFADPRLTGDWQRGADQYARMFLGVIAAGIQRFTAYSIHGVPRHGDPTHMMVEPGPLLRPMHLTVSALAQFVEGARYNGCLAPSADISAHVFVQPHERYFSSGPSTVVVLLAHGEAPEPLPNPLPRRVRCYDAWGNPTTVPRQAVQSPRYLVATGRTQTALLQALQVRFATNGYGPGVEGLLQATLNALDQGRPPLWSLFSSQGSLATLADGETVVNATRASLRAQPAIAKRFRLPGVKPSVPPQLQRAGTAMIGWTELTDDSTDWVMTFTAVPDGPQEQWRLTTLAIVPRAGALTEPELRPVAELLKRWEQGVGKGDVFPLSETIGDDPFCSVFAMPRAEVLTNPDYFMTMLHGLVAYGLERSALSLRARVGKGHLATAIGTWDVDSPFTGPMKLGMTATLTKEQGRWKLVTLSLGPQLGSQ